MERADGITIRERELDVPESGLKIHEIVMVGVSMPLFENRHEKLVNVNFAKRARSRDRNGAETAKEHASKRHAYQIHNRLADSRSHQKSTPKYMSITRRE
jgi:hypothetical protein